MNIPANLPSPDQENIYYSVKAIANELIQPTLLRQHDTSRWLQLYTLDSYLLNKGAQDIVFHLFFRQ